MKKKIILSSLSLILILIFSLIILFSTTTNNKIGLNPYRLGESINDIKQYYPNAEIGTNTINDDIEEYGAIEVPAPAANYLLDAGIGKEFYPIYVERFVIVRNNELTDETVSGYKDLIDGNSSFRAAITDSYLSSLTALNISTLLCFSDDINDAYELLKSQYDKGLFDVGSYDEKLPEEFTITTDYEARRLLSEGKNISIITPIEGSIELTWGLFVINDSFDTSKLKEIAKSSGFTLCDGDATTKFDYDIYQLEDDVFNSTMISRVPKLRRTLYGTYKFSGSNSDERAVVLIVVISLLVVWAVSIGLRINDMNLRNSVITCLSMLLLWVLLRYLKVCMSGVLLQRYIWYLSYIPLIFAPALFLVANIIIAYPTKNKKSSYITIYSIALAIFLLVITNDLTEATFKLKDGAKDGYGFNFYLICLVCFVELVISVILLIKDNIHRAPKWVLISSVVLIVFIIVYIALDFVGVRIIVEQDYTIVVSVFAFSLLELSLQAGLIQNCGKYNKLFNEMSFKMSISKKDDEIVYKTNDFSEIKENERITKFRIRNGYTSLLDDLSEIENLKLELQNRTNTLEKNNKILKNEQKVMAEYYSLKAQQTIFDELDKDFENINSEIENITDKISDNMERASAYPLLSRIKFLVSYAKQKYNSILNSKLDDKMEVQTVALAINLISIDAKTLGVDSGLLCSSMELIPSKYGVILIDIFYMMMENAISNKCDLFTNVDVRDGYIVMFALYPENVILSYDRLSTGVIDLINSNIITKEEEPNDNMLKLTFKIRSDN